MEPSTADEDLTVTNVHSGEEYVSENSLDNATEINENGQNIAYSENTIFEPDVNTGGDVSGIETASTSDRPMHGETQNLLGNQLKILVRLNILNLTKHGQKFKEPLEHSKMLLARSTKLLKQSHRYVLSIMPTIIYITTLQIFLLMWGHENAWKSCISWTR
jgi:hypothetical protein